MNGELPQATETQSSPIVIKELEAIYPLAAGVHYHGKNPLEALAKEYGLNVLKASIKVSIPRYDNEYDEGAEFNVHATEVGAAISKWLNELDPKKDESPAESLPDQSADITGE